MAVDHVTCDVYTANMTSLVEQAELIVSEARHANTTLSLIHI